MQKKLLVATRSRQATCAPCLIQTPLSAAFAEFFPCAGRLIELPAGDGSPPGGFTTRIAGDCAALGPVRHAGSAIQPPPAARPSWFGVNSPPGTCAALPCRTRRAKARKNRRARTPSRNRQMPSRMRRISPAADSQPRAPRTPAVVDGAAGGFADGAKKAAADLRNLLIARPAAGGVPRRSCRR